MRNDGTQDVISSLLFLTADCIEAISHSLTSTGEKAYCQLYIYSRYSSLASISYLLHSTARVSTVFKTIYRTSIISSALIIHNCNGAGISQPVSIFHDGA